jgi:hypothetical protein
VVISNQTTDLVLLAYVMKVECSVKHLVATTVAVKVALLAVKKAV